MLKTTKKTAKKGFTLIELIIVIAILGILAAIIIPRLSGVKDNAKVTANRENIQAIQKALESYHAQYDVYPASAQLTGTAVGANLNQYLDKVPEYKGGNAIVNSYTCDSNQQNYTMKLNDDPGTGSVTESSANYYVTPDTDSSKLFK